MPSFHPRQSVRTGDIADRRSETSWTLVEANSGSTGGFGMPWRERSVIEEREGFVRLAQQPGGKKRQLCERFEIRASTGHKWLGRYREEGESGLGNRSRRPHHSPSRTAAATEAAVLRIRDGSNNAWGARKIARVMEREGLKDVPALSTITEILRRHGRLEEHKNEHPGPLTRFERAAPNELWQMDFKGHFAIGSGRCHPLT